MTDLNLRHLTEDQLESYIDVVARSKAYHPFERRLTIEEARTFTLKDPDFDPEGSWLAYIDGEAVGFTSALIEKNRIASGMNDGYVEVEVVPEHRGKDIEQQLLDLSLGYLRTRKMDKARTRSLVTDTWRRSLLEPLSFEEAYRIYLLARQGPSEVLPADLPEGFRIERRLLVDCTDAEMATMVDVLNDSFSDHFNFAPEPLERLMNFRDNLSDPFMISLVMKGDQAVGVCMSEESKVLNEERGVKTGWIDVLGVRTPFRRRGLARAMLADAIQWLLDRGLDTVHIGVFAKNEKALDLYVSFGFKKDHESIWYAKDLA